jgi:hypothetical protein
VPPEPFGRQSDYPAPLTGISIGVGVHPARFGFLLMLNAPEQLHRGKVAIIKLLKVPYELGCTFPVRSRKSATAVVALMTAAISAAFGSRAMKGAAIVRRGMRMLPSSTGYWLSI